MFHGRGLRCFMGEDRGYPIRMTSNSGAVLFDIDGTLVDSNYVHVDTWSRAFAEAGVTVPSWRIHRCIGMDGDKLLEALVGSADSAVALEAKDLHTAYYGDASAAGGTYGGICGFAG